MVAAADAPNDFAAVGPKPSGYSAFDSNRKLDHAVERAAIDAQDFSVACAWRFCRPDKVVTLPVGQLGANS